MDLREQVLYFQEVLTEQGLNVNDFELNIAGEAFRALLAGGNGELEVRYRPSDTTIVYPCDGTAGWIKSLQADLANSKFGITV